MAAAPDNLRLLLRSARLTLPPAHAMTTALEIAVCTGAREDARLAWEIAAAVPPADRRRLLGAFTILADP